MNRILSQNLIFVRFSIEMPFVITRVDDKAIYLKPIHPRPEVREVKEDQKPSDEMRKWLMEGHKKDDRDKNIDF